MQYELNGSTEAHDPTMPSTNTCPFLPGQTVNTLHVPFQKADRKRSASLTSLRKGDFMTMNPNDKYTTPRAAPPVPPQNRMPTAPSTSCMAHTLKHQRSDRSLSPSERSWSAKRLFRMRSRERGRDRSHSSATAASAPAAAAAPPTAPAVSPAPAVAETWSQTEDDKSSIASTESGTSSRSRDISPEALRLFLSHDIPAIVQDSRPTVAIPEDIVEEEDDDNFATSASSENVPFVTILSPPPFQRAHSSSSLASSAATIPSTIATPTISVQNVEEEEEKMVEPTPTIVASSTLELGRCVSHFSVSSDEGDDIYTPTTPLHAADSGSYFDDSSDGEDDEDGEDDNEGLTPPSDSGADENDNDSSASVAFQQTKPLFSTYSLPRSSEGERLKTAATTAGAGAEVPAPIGSPALIAGDVPAGNTSLLAAPPAESGFDDLVSELGWMVDYYRSKPSI